MEKVRYGIIGLGVQGGKYAELISSGQVENSILSAICTTNENKKEKIVKQYTDVKVFLDYKKLILSKTVDAIIITCPSQYHVEIAKFALENKVSVLNEKPAGIHSKSVNELKKVYDENRELTYSVLFNQRTNTIFQDIKQIISSKKLGEFRRLNWICNNWYRPYEYYKSGDWRAKYSEEGGGLVINQAQHNLDIICYMVGLPKSLYAKTLLGYKRDITVDTDISVIFQFENGATGTFVSCTHDMLGTNRLEIDLSKGKIVVENDECTILTFFDDEENVNLKFTNKEFREIENKFIDKKTIKNQNAEGATQYILYLQNFTDNILNNKKLYTTIEESGYSVLLSDAINLSGYYKKEVSIPVDEDEYLAFLNMKIKEENEIY